MEHLGFIMTQTPKFTIYHFLKFYNVLPHLQCYHLTKFLSYYSPKVKTHVFTIAFRVLHDFSLPDYLFCLVSYCSPPCSPSHSDLLFFLHTRHLTEQRMRWPGCFIDTCETCVLISVSCLLKCRFLSEVFSGHSSEISVSFRTLTLPISQPLLYLLSLALVVQTLYYFTYPAFDFLLTPRKLQ